MVVVVMVVVAMALWHTCETAKGERETLAACGTGWQADVTVRMIKGV